MEHQITFSQEEGQAIHRALLTYIEQLTYAAIANNEVVAPEMYRVHQLMERVSLQVYCPIMETTND